MTTEQITETTTLTHAPGAYWLSLANNTTDPLDCIAMALTGLLEIQVSAAGAEAQADDQSALLDTLDEELGAKIRAIEAVREALGKSTSQVAEKVRAALGDAPAKAPEPAAQTPSPGGRLEQPVRDDDIETWRAYGRQEGVAAVEELNRSQIRSALGIPNA